MRVVFYLNTRGARAYLNIGAVHHGAYIADDDCILATRAADEKLTMIAMATAGDTYFYAAMYTKRVAHASSGVLVAQCEEIFITECFHPRLHVHRCCRCRC